MIPIPTIPFGLPQALIIAPVQMHQRMEDYFKTYSNSQFCRQFDLIFHQTVEEAVKAKEFSPLSGVLYEDLLGVQDLSYLQVHFETTFAIVQAQTELQSTSKVFDQVCQASMEFLKQRILTHERLSYQDVVVQYKLICYQAELIALIRPPNIDKGSHEISVKSGISFFSAELLAIQELEFAGNSQFRSLFEYKSEFLEQLERFLQLLQDDIRKGFTVRNIALFTSAFRLKCELKVVQYQKELYSQFNESELSARQDGTIEVKESYSHVRNAKSEVLSPIRGTRHQRTKSGYMEQYDEGGYLILINDALQLLELNFYNFELVKIAEECKIRELETGEDVQTIYELEAANLLLNSQSYWFILYLFLMNLVITLIYMILLSLMEIRGMAKLYLTDEAGSGMQKIYKILLEEEAFTADELFIKQGCIFDIFTSIEPPNFGLQDVDFISAEDIGLEQRESIVTIKHFPVATLIKSAYALREMLMREVFGELFTIVKPVNFLLRVFEEISEIDVMANVQDVSGVALRQLSPEPPEMPSFADFEGLILAEKLELDFCERFCKSQAYSFNYLVANILVCKLIRTLQPNIVANKQFRLNAKFNYYLSRLYALREKTDHSNSKMGEALLNKYSVLQLDPNVLIATECEELEGAEYFLGSQGICSDAVTIQLPGKLIPGFSVRFEHIVYRSGDSVELLVYFEHQREFERIVFACTFSNGEKSKEITREIVEDEENKLVICPSLLAFVGVIKIYDISLLLFAGSSRAVMDYKYLQPRAEVLGFESCVRIECEVDKIYLGEICEFKVRIIDQHSFLLQVVENLSVTQTEENVFQLRYNAKHASPLVLVFIHEIEEVRHKINIELPVQYTVRFLPLKFIEIDGVKYFHDLYVQSSLELIEDGVSTIVPLDIPGFTQSSQPVESNSRNYCFMQRYQRNAQLRADVETVCFGVIKYNFKGRRGDIPIERHFRSFLAPQLEIEAEYEENVQCNSPFQLELKILGFGRLNMEICPGFIILGCQQVDLAIFGQYIYTVRLIYEEPGRRELTYSGRFNGKSIKGCLGNVLLHE